MDIILDFVCSCWFAVVGAVILLFIFLYRLIFFHVSGERKLAKMSKYEIEHWEEYINRVNGDLNSRKHGRVAYHHKRLVEILNTINEKSHLKKNKEFRPKLAILAHKVKKCKKRIDESMKGKYSGNELYL